MPAIRSSAEIAKKWAEVTPGRQSQYEAGVRNPLKSWQSGASAAASAYYEGVTTAASEKRYERGVSKAGDEKWKRKTTELGPGRWGTGVRASQADYQTGFDPYASTIAGTTLPARYPAGDPRNIQRVEAIASALHRKKISG